MMTNNKGGVGKTTITFNLGTKLAEMGYKICLIDLDAQCNLTNYAMGDYFEKNLFTNQTKTIYDMLKNIIIGGGDIDKDITLQNIRNNLFLLPGSPNIIEFENNLISSFGEAAVGYERGYFVSSSLNRYLNYISLKDEFDIILIDTPPNLGLLNKVTILSSDYFILPLMPDGFSVQGIEHIGKTFEEWKDNWKKTGKILARDKNITADKVLDGEGLFIGYILNSYNKYADNPIRDNQKWIDMIPEYVKKYLSEKHCKNGLVESSYKKSLSNIKDFGKLAPLSQYKNKAIFELDPESDNFHTEGTIESWNIAKEELELLSNNLLEILNKY